MSKVNSQQYLDLNPDVKAAGMDPLFHFLTYVCPVAPLREPRIIEIEPPPALPADWNWEWYVAGYKDLRDAGIDTQAKAENHFLAFGYKEGRWPPPPLPPQPTLPPDWDWQKYVAAYLDLQNAGIDTKAKAEAHYLAYGFYEKRWPVPGPEIKSWQRLPECDNPISPYFSVDWPLMGTYGYQGGDRSSEVYRYPHDKVMTFQAESVISMLDGICLLELGGPQAKGQIYYQADL